MPHEQHFQGNNTHTRAHARTHTRRLFHKPNKFIWAELLWWHHSWQVSLFNLAQERRHPQVWHFFFFFQTRLKPACQHVSQKCWKKLVPAKIKLFWRNNSWADQSQVRWSWLQKYPFRFTSLSYWKGSGWRGVFVFSEPLDELCNPISPSIYAVAYLDVGKCVARQYQLSWDFLHN